MGRTVKPVMGSPNLANALLIGKQNHPKLLLSQSPDLSLIWPAMAKLSFNPPRSIFLFLLLLAGFGLSGCLVGRFLVYNFADIKDYKKFPSRPLTPSAAPFRFVVSPDSIEPKLHLTDSDPGQALASLLQKNKTVAFLIIRRDTIIYERYFRKYGPDKVVPSFSMAKSVTSALIGCAIADGLIRSIDDKVEDYLPELKGRPLEGVTIRHVLQMTSGIRFNESYINPFGDAAKYYYGRHLRRYVAHMKPAKAPGTSFEYHSGNTQLLGVILDRVLKGKTITAYLQEKIWTPLRMEYPASWSIDKRKNGMEKTFCGINATARDFAKFGRLYLKNGNWEGKQLVPEAWVKASTVSDRSVGGVSFYQYQWWIPSKKGDFMAEGILGQFIYVDPKSETIIVRLGVNEGDVDWERIFQSLAGYVAKL